MLSFSVNELDEGLKWRRETHTIHLRKAETEEEMKAELDGACVIPYTVTDDVTYLLLGRTPANAKRAARSSSICVLGGKVDRSDRIACEMDPTLQLDARVAAREFMEETLASLPMLDDLLIEDEGFDILDTLRLRTEHLSRLLSCGHFWRRLSMVYEAHGSLRRYAIFIVFVPPSMHAPALFSATRERLRDTPLPKGMQHSLLEIHALHWFSLHNLLMATTRFGGEVPDNAGNSYSFRSSSLLVVRFVAQFMRQNASAPRRSMTMASMMSAISGCSRGRRWEGPRLALLRHAAAASSDVEPEAEAATPGAASSSALEGSGSVVPDGADATE